MNVNIFSDVSAKDHKICCGAFIINNGPIHLTEKFELVNGNNTLAEIYTSRIALDYAMQLFEGRHPVNMYVIHTDLPLEDIGHIKSEHLDYIRSLYPYTKIVRDVKSCGKYIRCHHASRINLGLYKDGHPLIKEIENYSARRVDRWWL